MRLALPVALLLPLAVSGYSGWAISHTQGQRLSVSHRQALYPFRQFNNDRKNAMSLGTILLIVLILLLVGVFPVWPHTANWGYGPSGGLGLVLVIIIILVILGRI